MRAKLVGVPGSHPCISAELMLRYKGVEFSRFDLPNMTHKAILPLMRYRGSTVPVMTIEGKRVSGTMKIARALEALVPEPPLFGDESVESAEAWADSVLQDGVRQLARYAIGQDKESMATLPARAAAGHPDAARASSRSRSSIPSSRARCARSRAPPRPAWPRCPASWTASTRCWTRA